MNEAGNGKKRINYIEILQRAWKITWNNKYLWWFGLIMALGSGGGNINMYSSFDGQDQEKSSNSFQIFQHNFTIFFETHKEWIISGMLVLMILLITLMVLKIISQAAIIKAVDKIEKGGKLGFKMGFIEGKKYFWKIITLRIVTGLFIALFITLLATPVIYLFYLKSYPIAFLSLFLAFLISVPLIVIASFIVSFGILYIVLGNIKVTSALENGYKIFRKNVGSSIIMTLIFIPISILALAVMVIAMLPLILLFVPLGIILYLTLKSIGIAIMVIIGILIFLAIFLSVGSIYNVFYQAAWVLFFKEIATVKEDKVEVIKRSVVGEKVPEPESA